MNLMLFELDVKMFSIFYGVVVSVISSVELL